jgi:triacylglycerol lipase
MVAGALGCLPKLSRCDELKDELDRCIGSKVARLDCSTVSEADIDHLLSFSRGVSCPVLVSALPGDGDLRSATCRALGVGCLAPATPAPKHTPARYPVLLVNGIDTSPLFRYSDRILRVMTELGGHQVFLATLTPYEATRRRTPLLWKRIQEVRSQTGAEKVNLICHSLGGLDCRYLVSPHGLAADLGEGGIAATVASITTVGTAHRGTRISDVLLGLMPDGERGEVLNDFASLVGDWFSEEALRNDPHLREALLALSITQAAAFNSEITDAPGILYQSWAGYSRPFGEASAEHDTLLAELCRTSDGQSGLPARGKHDYMALMLVPFTDVVGRSGDDFVPNDGLAAVDSARWGNFRGCIPADHMEQLGQRNLPDVNVQNGFDVARFYANIAGELAEKGL